MAGRQGTRGPAAESERDLGPHADPESVARMILLDKLTAHPRSRHELSEALAVRHVPAEVASRVLDRFEDVGLVDDAAFAAEWVRSRQVSRGLSRIALAHELRRKGVEPEIVRESVDAIDVHEEWAAARALVEKRLRGIRHLPPTTKTRRLTGLLARKGYPAGLALAVVREALTADLGVDPADHPPDDTDD
jgi:regulatory protein